MDVSLSELRELVIRQGGLACCDSWGCKESDITELKEIVCVSNLTCTVLSGHTQFSSVQFSHSVNSRSLLILMSIESVMPSSYLTLCCPLFLLPPISPSIRAFSNESTVCVRWPKFWSFSISVSPSNEHPGLISFRMD